MSLSPDTQRHELTARMQDHANTQAAWWQQIDEAVSAAAAELEQMRHDNAETHAHDGTQPTGHNGDQPAHSE